MNAQPALDPRIRLRRAAADDAAGLAALAAALFEQTYAAANTATNMQTHVANTFTVEKQTAELANPARATWLVERENGEVVGYASALIGSRIDVVDAARPAEVERIYVDRSLHGQKVGDRLMDACVEHATAAGCDVLWLGVWSENPRAIAFYERRGFTRVGEKSFRLGDDLQRDYVMARRLA